jgi:hypothetical protein
MIKNWNLFKESIDNEWEINKICKKYGIKNYTINDDLSIDVKDNVFLYSKGLNDILPLKFRRVDGYVDCSSNKLKSLRGCPKWIGGDFYCYQNIFLTSLEFGPEYVGGDFDCRGDHNFPGKLTSLEHLPTYIGGNINCKYNKIWSFKGIPDNFRGELICNYNPIQNIWKLFKSSKDIEFFNDCDIVREPQTPDGLPIVVLERLNFFLETIGKPPVEKVDGYINI